MKLLVKRRFNLDISTTIIYKLYKKKGLIRRPQKRLPWYKSLKDPVIPKVPGDVAQVEKLNYYLSTVSPLKVN
ncbi:hypothetical protein A3H53_04325 [Candidatus Nomurabacteria bacterium RIFCSPLOWO2_02_FULL_40_10]|uniref:Uncharacterized protein n=1 Tax=Candidatus Nomurabacteria bacterium RIFCSPLOWO2_02_FULL_40_10 TaxID=1801786 RepID=A0A1F6XX88_9BACT|nr:MAG: hypothetical protein A3H53_04325 [Candidatus Nomurabacteria bacterium RIFCSPLOWO2_02_FULL_40_10]